MRNLFELARLSIVTASLLLLASLTGIVWGGGEEGALASNAPSGIVIGQGESGAGPQQAVCLGDADCDGWTDLAEAVIGTDPLDNCADHALDNAWPADVNNDRVSDITDVSALTANFGLAVLPAGLAPARHDLAPDSSALLPDGFVDITDITAMVARFGTGCGRPDPA